MELPSDAILLMPPILGLDTPRNSALIHQIQEHISRPVAELSGGYSSLFGVRLFHELSRLTETHQITRINEKVIDFDADSSRINAVQLENGNMIPGDAFILATGRFLSCGFSTEPPLTENLFQLPLFLDGKPIDSHITPERLLKNQNTEDQPLFRAGLLTDDQLHPLSADRCIAYENLFCAGTSLGGTDVARDNSAWGISLITGLLAGNLASGRSVEALWA
jgi:anaerobic glycerol-3-phosphate dehydrogenase